MPSMTTLVLSHVIIPPPCANYSLDLVFCFDHTKGDLKGGGIEDDPLLMGFILAGVPRLCRGGELMIHLSSLMNPTNFQMALGDFLADMVDMEWELAQAIGTIVSRCCLSSLRVCAIL